MLAREKDRKTSVAAGPGEIISAQDGEVMWGNKSTLHTGDKCHSQDRFWPLEMMY